MVAVRGVQGPAGAGHGWAGYGDRVRAPALPAGVRLRCRRPPVHRLPQGVASRGRDCLLTVEFNVVNRMRS